MTLKFEKNRFLSEFSTFGIGGPIADFVEVKTIDEMEEAMGYLGPKLIVGKGSNCLFDDAGFQGLVILNKIDFCNWEENEVTVGSGYNFSLLGVQSARRHLSGLEFASGIPATVGGAIFMNAGANGKETSDSLKCVTYFDGKRSLFTKDEMQFSYRTSPFQKMKGVILSATFSLTPSLEARDKQLAIIDYRMKTQPLKEKSIGCIFRNPEGVSAGALIDQCGLKGVAIGGAMVSTIHANFIINKDNASFADVRGIIELVQERVFQQTGIFLEPEYRTIYD